MVYRVAYRFAGTAEDADELSQECFVRAYRQLARYDRRRPFKPWLMRVCSNVCLNWAKARSRRSAREEPLHEEHWTESGDNIETATLKNMERQAVMEALNSLSPDIRLLLVMRFISCQTFREISEQTGVKLPTVAWRVSKGIEKLRESLSAEGVIE